MTTRRPRARRVPDRQPAITDRDVEVLVLTGLCRVIALDQLARALFPSQDRCRRRVRRLFDAGLVRITLAGSTRPNLVSLTPAGLKKLENTRPHLPEIHLPGAVRLAGLDHRLGVVETRLYLVALAENENGRLLAFESGIGSLARSLGFIHFHLVPDAVVEMEFADGRPDEPALRLAIEVDCGTESGQVLSRKLARYRDVLEAGLVHELWLVYKGGDKREEHLRSLIVAAGLDEQTRIINLGTLKNRPVARPPKLIRGAVRAEGPNTRYQISSSSLEIPAVGSILSVADR